MIHNKLVNVCFFSISLDTMTVFQGDDCVLVGRLHWNSFGEVFIPLLRAQDAKLPKGSPYLPPLFIQSLPICLFLQDP